ncbi:MAG TPA: hypothetical protein VI542_10570, partial [Candidatus Tectomicrobia bacterium]
DNYGPGVEYFHDSDKQAAESIAKILTGLLPGNPGAILVRKQSVQNRNGTMESGSSGKRVMPNPAVERTGKKLALFSSRSPLALGFQKYLAFSHGSRTINPERGHYVT